MLDYRTFMTNQVTKPEYTSDPKEFVVQKAPTTLQMNKRIASEEGMEFPAVDLDYLSSPDIDIDDVRAATKVAIVSASMRKLEKLIFEGAELQVSPPDDIEVSEEEIQNVQTKVEAIDRVIRTGLRMRQAWFDRQHYGSAIFEKIPGKADTWKAFQVFKRLPAYSFDEKPTERSDFERYVFGDLLEGIVYDTQTSEFEYWQRQTSVGIPKRIDSKNVLHIRRETSDSPDGESVIIPILPLIKKLVYIEKALMQRVIREGAPGLDVSVKEFRDEPSAQNPEAWNFQKRFTEAKKIAKNHGKDTVICHPDSIELKGLDYKNDFDVKAIVEYYEQRILNALIPKDFTDSAKSGNLSSNAANLDVLVLYIQGEQHEIAEPFLKLWSEILAENGYPDWKVEVVWRDLTPMSETEKFKQVEIGAKVGIFTEDELREMVGYAAKTDEEAEEVAEQEPEEVTEPEETEAIPTSEEEAIEQNSAGSQVAESDIKDLLARKPAKLMAILAEHGIKPWELPFEG